MTRVNQLTSVKICCVLLVMLLVHTQAQKRTCEQVNICITNGTYRDSCQSPDIMLGNISILGNHTLLLCQNVSIQFTGGTHYLTNNVDFPLKVDNIRR